MLGAVAGCSQTQLSTYTAAATATSTVLKQIGGDVVSFDCRYGALIQAVAQDANAAARVQAALAHNAKLTKDACPAAPSTAVVNVVAGQ